MKLILSCLAVMALPLMTFAQDILTSQEIDSLRARTPAYNIDVKDEAVMQRSFLQYDDRVLCYGISVGDPSGMHYAINSLNGALIEIWRGDFLDASLMYVWKARGICVAVPRGVVTKLGNEKAFAKEEDAGKNWGDSLNDADGYTFLGYDVDKKNRPLFRYRIDGVQVEDHIMPVDNKFLSRTLHFDQPPPKNFYHRIATGSSISKSQGNTFLIDKTVKIKVPANSKVSIKKQNGKQLLLVQLTGDITYDIMW